MGLTQNDPYFQPEFEADDTSVLGVVDLYGVHDITDTQRHIAAVDPAGAYTHFFARAYVQKRRRKHWYMHEAASPVHYVTGCVRRRAIEFRQRGLAEPYPSGDSSIPPIFGVHGELDTVIPIADARAFYAALNERRRRDNQIACDVFVEVPCAHHAFNYIPSPRAQAMGAAVADWCWHVVESQSNARFNTNSTPSDTRPSQTIRAKL